MTRRVGGLVLLMAGPVTVRRPTWRMAGENPRNPG